MTKNAGIFSPRQQRVYRIVFYSAAAYNFIWGTFVILFPSVLFRWAGMEPPKYPQIWQCVGMLVLVFGMGYWYVARDPERYAPLALIGLLGKILGPIGWMWGFVNGQHPGISGWVIVFNDLIWWPVFIPFVWLGVIRPRPHSHPRPRRASGRRWPRRAGKCEAG